MNRHEIVMAVRYAGGMKTAKSDTQKQFERDCHSFGKGLSLLVRAQGYDVRFLAEMERLGEEVPQWQDEYPREIAYDARLVQGWCLGTHLPSVEAWEGLHAYLEAGTDDKDAARAKQIDVLDEKFHDLTDRAVAGEGRAETQSNVPYLSEVSEVAKLRAHPPVKTAEARLMTRPPILTHEQIAQAMGMGRQTVSAILSGRQPMPAEFVRDLDALFDAQGVANVPSLCEIYTHHHPQTVLELDTPCQRQGVIECRSSRGKD